MTTPQISNNGRIFLQVGMSFNTDREAILEDGKAPEGRLVVKAGNPQGRMIKTLLLAVYESRELAEWDRQIISKHRTFDATLEDGSVVKYVGFTYEHFFETLRARKLKSLASRGMLAEDDGTIFGRVSKEIRIAERVIPAHNYEIWLEWDCWNDMYATDETQDQDY